MRFYRNNCAGCHGDSQGPSAWGTRGFYPPVPQFAQDPPRKPDWQIFWVAKHGVRYSGMGAWSELAPDRKLWQAATFLSRLRSLPPGVETLWRNPPSRP